MWNWQTHSDLLWALTEDAKWKQTHQISRYSLPQALSVLFFDSPNIPISNLILSKYYINHISVPAVSLKPCAMWKLFWKSPAKGNRHKKASPDFQREAFVAAPLQISTFLQKMHFYLFAAELKQWGNNLDPRQTFKLQ